MGEDFNYLYAEMWFINLDKLIRWDPQALIVPEKPFLLNIRTSLPNILYQSTLQIYI